MVSEQIQPIESLGAVDPAKAREEALKKDPAKRDYVEGRELYKKGEYAQAAIALHNALLGFEEQGNEQGVANAADRLGDVCLAQEKYELALKNYDRAFAICEKEEDSFSILSLNKKKVQAWRGLGALDKALEICFDMMEHYRLTSNPKGVVDVLLMMADLYEEQGENAKAADACRTASSIHANFKHKRKAEELAARAEELEAR